LTIRQIAGAFVPACTANVKLKSVRKGGGFESVLDLRIRETRAEWKGRGDAVDR